jgi:hypothetical protein
LPLLGGRHATGISHCSFSSKYRECSRSTSVAQRLSWATVGAAMMVRREVRRISRSLGSPGARSRHCTEGALASTSL